jgi:hypothetical protein
MSEAEETNPVKVWFESMREVFPWAGNAPVLRAMHQGQTVTAEEMEAWKVQTGQLIKGSVFDTIERLPLMPEDKLAAAKEILTKHIATAMLEIYPAILPYTKLE